MFFRVMIVALGGAIGAVLRYSITGFAVQRWGNMFPVGTLIVNVLGCLLIGGLAFAASEREQLSEATRLLLITGLLGSLTTFSTFGFDTFEFLKHGHMMRALSNVGLNLVLGLVSVAIGWYAMRLILGTGVAPTG